jgi:polyphosphate kinase
MDTDIATEAAVEGTGSLDEYDGEESTAVEDATLPPDRFLDRELSWLAFNKRVLELAEDPSVPLLERANFLAIFASNLDEFFMVRVAGLKRRIETGLAVPTNIGTPPADVLETVSAQALELQVRHALASASSRTPRSPRAP